MTAFSNANERSPLTATHNRRRPLLNNYLQQDEKPPKIPKSLSDTRADLRWEARNDEEERQVFRRRQVWLDDEDEQNQMWTIKRANPVLDDDEDCDDVDVVVVKEDYQSPFKKARVLSLRWTSKLSEDWGDKIGGSS